MAHGPTVSIIIPNWNGQELLKRNLPQVLAVTEEAEEIIVVDDGSTDDSVNMLREKFPKIRVLLKKTHEGFASTVNLGVRAANSDIVVLLNTDVEPEKNFLAPLLLDFNNPNVFAVGCMDKSIEMGKMTLRGRGLAKWEKGFYVHSRGDIDKTDTAWVSGGSGAFRKNLWEKLGGMDTLFNPFYWEDIDISYRAKRMGYRLIFEPKSVVRHYHERGKILMSYSNFFIKRISYRNQFLFVWKHVRGRHKIAHCLWAPPRLVQALMSGDIAMVTGYISAIVHVVAILRYRFESFRENKVVIA